MNFGVPGKAGGHLSDLRRIGISYSLTGDLVC